MSTIPSSPSDALEQVRNALALRLEIVADTALRDTDPEAHLEKLKAASLDLIELHQRLAAELPARLNHFMESGSYVKALEMLQPKT